MKRIILTGCAPEPLAGYLKALGVLRLVAEQVDPEARGAWIGGRFVVDADVDEPGLVAFLLERYRPTPVITPWNGGSGFWDGDNQSGIVPIQQSTSERFDAYRSAILHAREHVTRSGLRERPDSKRKLEFVQHLRSTLADEVLPWVDAALVFTRESLVFPPLLGTGGNDGRLDFANNFMQRLREQLLDVNPSAASLVRGALFGAATIGLGDLAIGQFFPGAAGGANGGPGFKGAGGTNPWDYILLVEGAICFATALVRRLESGDRASMTYPFSVRSSAAGFGSAAAGEPDSRDELWLPIWSKPATWREISAVFCEGRSRVGRRAAASGTDFARSLASLGVDRGIDAFTRYAFHLRNGLAYQAVPLGRWPVADTPSPVAALLDRIDPWILEVSRLTGKEVPARVRAAVRRLDEAIVDAVKAGASQGAGPGDVQRLLIAISEIEATTADSKDHAGLRHPVPPLPAEDWIPLLVDDTPEFDLAASLAMGLRPRWSAAQRHGARWVWAETRLPPASRVWRRGPLVERLLDLLHREQVEASRGTNERGPEGFDLGARWFASLRSVNAFLEGRVDEARVTELARALSLLEWRDVREPPSRRDTAPAVFAAARVVVGGAGDVLPPAPPVPGLFAAARRDDGPTFTALVWRRLAASGVMLRGLHRRSRASMLRQGEQVEVRRVGAACRFPLCARDRARLLESITVVTPEVSS